MRRLLLPLLVLPLAGLAARTAEDADARLAAFFKEFLDAEFKARPLEATRLGDHRFDDLLDDVSPSARAGGKNRYQGALAELPRRVDSRKLSRGGQIDYEIFRHELAYKLWELDNTRPFEDDPQTYNLYLTDSVYLLFTQSTLPKATNVKNAAARIDALPRVVAAAKASLKKPARELV